jgi:MtN3 and saliva related transmembrane protein
LDTLTLVGLGAAACTTIAFIPQIVRNHRRRSAGDLSLLSFSVFTAGVILWLVYGLAINNLPIIVANVLTLGVNLINLGQMVWYRRHPAASTRV